MHEFSKFAEREKAGWSDPSVVEAYVARFGPITDEAAKTLVDRFASSGLAMLDLCCGQGRLTAMMKAAGADVSGLDFSPGMLALAAKAVPGVPLHEADAAAMPFDDGAFDVVLCNFGMMHLPDQHKALQEIRRVLRPSGRFAMATWVGPEASPAFAAVFAAIKAHADFSNAPPQPDLFAFARPDEARARMAAAGLRMTAHDVITPAWELSAPEELFDIFLNATVGAAMLIKSQTPQIIYAIRDQITQTVAEKHAVEAGFRVPVPVAIVCAQAA